MRTYVWNPQGACTLAREGEIERAVAFHLLLLDRLSCDCEPHSLLILWFDFSFCVVSQLWLVDSGGNSDGLSDVDGDGCSHAHRERWARSLWGFFLSLKGLKLQTPEDGCWHLVVSCIYGSVKLLNGRSCNTKANSNFLCFHGEWTHANTLTSACRLWKVEVQLTQMSCCVAWLIEHSKNQIWEHHWKTWNSIKQNMSSGLLLEGEIPLNSYYYYQ